MSKVGSRFGAISVAVSGLLLCGLALVWPEPKEHRPFALAVGVWPGMETLTLARESGVLAEQDVNFVELSWTSAKMMAFENRVVDGAVVTLDEMLRLKGGGHNIKAVLVMGASKGGDAILAHPAIKTLADLKGKRVGVELRACGEYFLTQALHTVEMTLEDVEIVPLNLAEAENAYEQHELDAVVTMDPGKTRLLEKGALSLFDSTQISQTLFRVLVVREDFLKNRRDILQSLVRAHFNALPVLQSDHSEEGMAAVLRRERLTRKQFSTALSKIEEYSQEENFTLLSPGLEGLEPILKKMASFMKYEGFLDSDETWQGLLDNSLVKGDL